jgi:hypothetical protein
MWKKVLTWLVVRAIALFYALLVALFFAWKYVTNRSVKFWESKQRDTAPDCLSDPQLGQHSYIQLKVRTTFKYSFIHLNHKVKGATILYIMYSNFRVEFIY